MLFSFPFRLLRRCGQSFFQRLYNFEGILVFQKVSAVALGVSKSGKTGNRLNPQF
jgi:hypothetical protein